MQYTNISGYRFVPLDQLTNLERRLRRMCESLAIKGTILLGEEGVNIAVAGESSSIEAFIQTIHEDPRFTDMEFKLSYSELLPFRRLRIRQKDEIIRMGVDSVAPAKKTGHHLSAEEFKQWLDEGRKITLLDTRNDYEIKVGTFENALNLGLENFRDFPEAVKELPADAKESPVVMFCTGGIRCEKTSALLLEYGYPYVYQLDGGIIKYFEKCGGAHWQGECFVFDNRVAVKTDLSPSDKKYCLNCLATLSEADLVSEQFAYNEHCPHCFVTV